MKKTKDASDWLKKIIYLLPVLLTGCSPAFGGGGFLIPLGSLLISIWCAGRYFFGWGNKESKGKIFPLICSLVLLALCIISYLLMASDK